MMKNKDLSTNFFVALVLILSVLFTAMGVVFKNDIVLALQQATPIIATIIVCIIFFREKHFKNIGINHIGKLRYYIVALIIPTLTLFISYFCGWILGFLKLGWQLQNPYLEITFPVIKDVIKVLFSQDTMYSLNFFYIVLIWGVAEEIGWRGFLQPRFINKFGVKKGICLTGLVWAIWHYPLILSGQYYESGNVILNTILFTIAVIIMGVSIGYVSYKTGSVWPAVIFHTKSNLTWQLCSAMFLPNSPKSIYLCGEAGIINIIIWSILAIFIFRKISNENKMVNRVNETVN
ncbi:type II CAAX endopeptidase family protein [Clostridium sp. MB40-C1]|uniref:CPBP family intramembrane glutamic endopeptidase n=1 Tax=Clostridium sp. MB40-C1 TaxID=3070996 RepID=UPI0027E0A8DC|nr:type II CAAX endopeptidase family protein [Clostridium sp. MB40-C1]WMJ81171.1 type II CAAX endopeptidase family protein [Clostridium sp. MB40-C1]